MLGHIISAKVAAVVLAGVVATGDAAATQVSPHGPATKPTN